ncbi:hypothetical protein H4F99_11485 [Lysobacter sp. SG-8]|uniref:Uncharacterized protein n=1 Tax=Marilutibacter penaei TaxID=2759900 RepID=A0A7W3YFD9_9GAMM|nr:hypothetical protein [Lysobacter penaei]MBB1089102.1 hypothetical protein [Lysobacter penaei]
MDPVIPNSRRWLWLAALTSFALASLSNGNSLLALGFLFLGVFAFFNNPLDPTSVPAFKTSISARLSWACGVLGIAAVLGSALKAWL